MQARLNRLQVDFVKFLNHAAEQYSRDSDILGIALQAIVILIAKVRVSRAIMIRIFSMSIFCRIFVRAVAQYQPTRNSLRRVYSYWPNSVQVAPTIGGLSFFQQLTF